MGWEYFRYLAKCVDCGHQGVCIQGDDDWGRKSTSWEGFENQSPDPTSVAKKRADLRESRAQCKCGSQNIAVGNLIKG